MFPQPRKWPGVIVVAALTFYLFSHPADAAHAVNGAVHAFTTFVSNLNVGH